MKKIITGLLAFFLTLGSALALDVEISGEIKTGFYYQKTENADGSTSSSARMNNNDGDAGDSEGRIRFGINLMGENFGVRTRFFQNNFSRGSSANDPNSQNNIYVNHAYAFGNFFSNQLTVSAGFLGESPWGTGGPELWRELEHNDGRIPLAGIRFEWKPTFVSFLNGLNLGFVLNMGDDAVSPDTTQEFGDALKESIVGIAWEHEYFAFRFAYRFDRGYDSLAAVAHGGRFVYRIEEHILDKLLPGMQIWANGYAYGLGISSDTQMRVPDSFIEHWVYALYDHNYFDAGINIRYHDKFGKTVNIQWLEIMPYFYWKFFNNLLAVGAKGGTQFGFNNGRLYKDYNTSINYWFVEPQVKVNINSSSYVALLYRYELAGTSDVQKITHWINLRLAYSF